MLANEWNIAPISDLLEREFPGEWGVEPNGQGNAKVLRSTNLDDDGHLDYEGGAERDIPKDKLRSKQLKLGDILLEASGGGPGKPVGRVAIFDPPDDRTYLCSNFFRVLRPSKTVFPKYLLWRLLFTYRNPRIWAFQQQTTGIINLKVSEYLWHVLTWPPLPEQRRIAEILDTADRAIGEAEALTSKLKRMKTGLMHDLLTCGLDERGQLRDPDARPEQFKDSPLGRIPREWEVRELSEALDGVIDFRGKTPRKLGMGWGGGEIPALSANNVKMGEIDFDKETYYGSEALYAVWMTKGDTQKGDIIITMEAPLGNIAQIPDDRKYILSQRVLLFKPKPELVVNDCLKHQLASHEFQSLLLENATGTTAKGIQQSRLLQLPLKVPSLQEQNRIAEILDAYDARIRAEEAYRDKLKLQKKGLMDDLLTGRVRVKTVQEVGV